MGGWDGMAAIMLLSESVAVSNNKKRGHFFWI